MLGTTSAVASPQMSLLTGVQAMLRTPAPWLAVAVPHDMTRTLTICPVVRSTVSEDRKLLEEMSSLQPSSVAGGQALPLNT